MTAILIVLAVAAVANVVGILLITRFMVRILRLWRAHDDTISLLNDNILKQNQRIDSLAERVDERVPLQ